MPLKVFRGQLHAYRIYPESRHGLYFVVRLFTTRSALAACIRAYGRTPGRGTIGIVMPWRTSSWDQRWRTGKFAGEIGLLAETAKNEVCAHEATHAALAWARRIGFADGIVATENARRRHAPVMLTRDCDEERFCYAVGRINKQIVAGLYACGVLQ